MVASRGHVQLWLMMVPVVLAAVIGDTVGYEIEKHFGPRVLGLKIMDKRRAKLEKHRISCAAVEVLPCSCAASSPSSGRPGPPRPGPQPCTIPSSWPSTPSVAYEAVAKAAGRDIAAIVVLVAVIALIVWRLRRVAGNTAATQQPQSRSQDHDSHRTGNPSRAETSGLGRP